MSDESKLSEQILADLWSRALRAAEARSDDFGHSVQMLHDWQAQECDYLAERVLELITEVRRLRALIDEAANVVRDRLEEIRRI